MAKNAAFENAAAEFATVTNPKTTAACRPGVMTDLTSGPLRHQLLGTLTAQAL